LEGRQQLKRLKAMMEEKSRKRQIYRIQLIVVKGELEVKALPPHQLHCPLEKHLKSGQAV